ncbi:MAG: signal peptide protein [Planctomycetaceae bacterium]|nr:signal peptide protein [Planctomycetaceae bacterium]
MKTLKIAILLVLGTACTNLAADGQETPVTLETAKEQGRVKSRFLKETKAATNTTDAIPKANLAEFQESVGPILKKSCLACHGPEKSEGRLRVDQLNPDLLTGPDVERWREVYNALSNSVMPPEDEPKYALADAARGNIVDWLSGELNKASLIRRNSKVHSSFRRLTKYEYNYALQDLLGLPYSLATKLPPETASEDGFKNSSELLQMSIMQFETYREIGLKALQRATVSGERPQAVTYIISMQDEMNRAAAVKDAKTFDKSEESYRNHRHQQHLFHRETGKGILFSTGKSMPQEGAVAGQTPAVSPVVLVLPRSNELKLDLDRFLPDEGIMRVRIRTGRSTMNPDEYASLRLIFSAHTSNNANFSQVISERDVPVTAPGDNPQIIDFDIPLGDIQRNPFRKLTTTFPRRDEFLHIHNVSNAPGVEERLNVLIDYIEISAPFYEQWPSKTHTDIFIASDNKSNEEIYGREVLNRFLRRAWRRPVTVQEVDPFMALFAKYRPGFSTFEEAMVEVLATVLATPEFLYLTQRVTPDKTEAPASISELELASRLSVFLWSSIPDDELLKLAEQGKLRETEVLAAQVKRMLADPRSRRFSQNFVEQWLGMDGLNNVTHVTDGSLREAMQEEPIAFFDEVLRNNHSILDFIHSDYAVVNERLAAHYGIPKVYGPHFRKVPVATETHRGGILTGAAILTMNSDGKDSHPLKRGVWMLKRILQDPPPPPPPNVPEVDLTDPKILQMTLKERIADHRNKAACASCHSRIDPWGIAFENYDALGVYRTQIKNQPVDATSVLFNHQTLAGMDGLKRYLLTDRQDQFARAMVHKLTAYALGRPLAFGDRADNDSLTAQFRQRNDGLGDLIQLIISSNLFNSK